MTRRAHGDRVWNWVQRFWRGDAGPVGTALNVALAPAELIYRTVTVGRDALYRNGFLLQAAPPIPVISVGNLTVGGTGKTPVSAMIAQQVASWGKKPAIVLRGYGQDEIAVHRELNPSVRVYANANRYTAVEAAAAEGADCAIVDDGFQHQQLHRKLDIVLVAAERWNSPRRLLPRGPWREPASALYRAHFCIVTRKSASAGEANEIAREIAAMNRLGLASVVHLAPTRLSRLEDPASSEPLMWLQGRSVLALSSLAEPQLYLAQLTAAGADAELLAYRDHQEFTSGDLIDIRNRLGGRALVMTRKEAVKLRGMLAGVEAFVLEQEAKVESGKTELFSEVWRVVAPS